MSQEIDVGHPSTQFSYVNKVLGIKEDIEKTSLYTTFKIR